MKNCFLFLLMLAPSFLIAQVKLVGFSDSGEINTEQEGGMIWEINEDGTGFHVLKSFQSEQNVSLIFPIGDMLIGPDGKGHGFAQSYGQDTTTQYLYQYDFTNKQLSLQKSFPDAPWDLPKIMGTDGFMYGSRRISPNQRVLSKISLEGEITDFYTFDCNDHIQSLIQTSNGTMVLGYQILGEGIKLIAGTADSFEWKTIKVFQEPDLVGHLSNLVAQNDDILIGANWNNEKVCFFKISPNGENYTQLFETPTQSFGGQISLGWGINGCLFALSQRNDFNIVSRIFTDVGIAPNPIFTDNNFGYINGQLQQSPSGDLYFHDKRTNALTKSMSIIRVKGDGTSVYRIRYITFTNDLDRMSSIYTNPTSGKMYFWRLYNDTGSTTLTSCKSDGSEYTEVYTYTNPGFSFSAMFPAQLFKASDGIYYGFLRKGGLNGNGVVFRIYPDGSGFKVLCQNPTAKPATNWYENQLYTLLEGSDGWLYGCAANENLFKINKDGTGFSIISSDFDYRCNFIESPDGFLYWGGNTLMRMEKDGSNKTIVSSTLIDGFTYYDFCRLLNLSNGQIAGVGSYTIQANCLDEYTYGIGFSYNQGANSFNYAQNPNFRLANTIKGNDGKLYFNNGSCNPTNMAINYYNIECDYFTDSPISYQLASPTLHVSNGLIYGQRSNYDGRWFPIAYDPETGTCEMSSSWDVTMGYNGQIAFEASSLSTPTVQPVLPEGVTLSPNPTNSSARVTTFFNSSGPSSLMVTDFLGHVVFEIETKVEIGEHVYDIPSNVLNVSGMYNVMLKTREGVWSHQLSVQ